MGDIGKIIEYVSTSDKSFDDAVRKAVEKFAKTEKVRGVNIKRLTVQVENGRIKEYRVNLKLSAEV